MNKPETQRLYDAAKATEQPECEHCDGPAAPTDDTLAAACARARLAMDRLQAELLASRPARCMVRLLDWLLEKIKR